MTTMLSIIERIPDEAAAWEYMEALRWKGTPECPHCGETSRAYFLTPRNGPRTTSTGATSARRLWKCGACRKQFSCLVGTIMHGSKIPLRTWVLVIFEMAANKNGVSAREIERRYGLTAKSAWFLLHRIREAMRSDGLGVLGGGGAVVVADETFIGGKVRNKHKQGKPKRHPVGAGARSGPAYGKVAVLTLVDRSTGEARSLVVPDVTGKTLRKAISEHVDMAGSVLHTDASTSYVVLGKEFIDHQSVDHSSNQYVRYAKGGHISSNQCENFFSQLKRSLDGTHHHVSRKHLGRYLGEFDTRYSTRGLDDGARMAVIVDRMVGRRLTYRPLVEG